MPRNGRRRTHNKKAIAIQAMMDLESTMLGNQDTTILNSASSLILRIGKKHGIRTVSYTHLTLPTILLV